MAGLKQIKFITNNIFTEKERIEIQVAGLEASKKLVQQKTRSGQKPLKKGGAYAPYSPNYSKSGTVDLRGKDRSLDRSFKHDDKSKLRFTNDPKGRLFNLHQQGAKDRRNKDGSRNPLPKRPIFPENNSEVHPAISNAMTKKAEEIIRRKYG